MATNLRVVGSPERMSPMQALVDAVAVADDCEEAVVVLLKKNGEIICGWSAGSSLTKIGMLQCAIDQIIQGCRE